MRVTVLEYHDLADSAQPNRSGFSGASAASYKLTPELFDAHLAALAFLPESCRVTADRILTEGARTPVMLTFDDGGVSSYTEIAPRLEHWGWIGHFFVATGWIGKAGFLSEIQIRELHQRGHVIGSHSVTHPLLMGRCSVAELREEWNSSVRRLCEILEYPVTIASVPGGYFSRAVAETAAEAGIRILFTSEPVTKPTSIRGCLVCGRYTLRRGDRPAIAVSLVKELSRERVWQAITWKAKKFVKAMLGSHYLKARAVLFRDLE